MTLLNNMDKNLDISVVRRANNITRLEKTLSGPISLSDSPLPLDVVLGYALARKRKLPKELKGMYKQMVSDMKPSQRIYLSARHPSLRQVFLEYSFTKEFTEEQIKYLAGIRALCK